MFRSARQPSRNFAGSRQFGTPSKKEIVSRINVLVLNAGVKSVKYGLFSIASRPAGHDWLQKDSFLLSSGLIDHVGDGDAPSIVTAHVLGRSTVSYTAPKRIKDSGAAFVEIVSLLTDPKQGPISSMKDIAVVGHRVVHGGPMSKAMVIDAQVMDQIRKSTGLAPLHNPANILGIEAAQRELGHAAHVAVFDTAFHQTMPPESYTYAIPKELVATHGIRKYGFHGNSYKFVLQEVADELGRRESELNAIICYLGKGSSMACIERGKCVDTSMGMTPLEGMVMDTRCGDIDPGIMLYLSDTLGLSPPELDELFNKRSGFVGMCGLSDMRDVEKAAIAGNEDALLAEKVYVQRVREYLGSYLVRLNGEVDALVFTGGIGENSARIREQICEGLQRFGISIDPQKNARDLSSDREISTAQSFSKVLVIRAHDELSIALQSVGAVAESLPLTGTVALQSAAQRFRADAEEARLLNAAPADGAAAADDVTGAAGLYVASHHVDHLTNPLVAQVGLMYVLSHRVHDVGYFRPFVNDEWDPRLQLMREVFGLRDTPESMYGVTMDEAADLLGRDLEDKLLERIVAKYLYYRRGHEFVVVGGCDARHLPNDWPANMDTQVAGALNLPMVWATNVAASPMPGESDASLLDRIVKTAASLRPRGDFKHVTLAGVMLTDIPEAKVESLRSHAQAALAKENIALVAAVPSHKKLQIRTIRDIANALDAKIVYSKSANSLDGVDVGSVIVGTATADKLLTRVVRRADLAERIDSTVIPESLAAALRAEFTKFVRADSDGHIKVREIGGVMAAMGYSPSSEWLRSVVTEVDRTGVGNVTIDFQTFLQLVLQRRAGAEGAGVGGSVTAGGGGGNVSGPLIVTNVGRVDVLFTLLLASLSSHFPRIAGILLTDAPDESALPHDAVEILHGLETVGIPVLCVPLDTYTATSRLQGPQGLPPGGLLTPSSTVKLQVISDLFLQSTCNDFVGTVLQGKTARTEMTSYIFQHSLVTKAKTQRMRIVLPEGTDWHVVVAASELLERDLCEIFIIGEPDKVLSLAKSHNADVSRAVIIDPRVAADVPEMAAALVALRKEKGMTELLATELLRTDPNWYATTMLYMGTVDGVVGGMDRPLPDTLRPALKIIKTAPGVDLVSSVSFMLLPDRVYCFGDCAINIEPTAEDLATIALSSAHSVAALGIQPRVAMISYATGSSNTGPIIDKVRKATAMAKAKDPTLLIEGPLQFDAAVHPEVAAIKCKGNVEVAGRATVCIFPDLNTGNTTYKAVRQATKCIVVGPITQGLRLPFNDLPTACTVKDVVNMVLVTCVQAQAARAKYPRGPLGPPGEPSAGGTKTRI